MDDSVVDLVAHYPSKFASLAQRESISFTPRGPAVQIRHEVRMRSSLVERCFDIAEVDGSIPFASTSSMGLLPILFQYAIGSTEAAHY